VANFIILLGGALGTNFIFFCLVLVSLGLARVRPLVFAKPRIVFVPFGIGVVWYLIMFAFQFAEPPLNVNDVSSYYVQTVMGAVIFVVIGVVGLVLIRKRMKKTRDDFGNNN
jgi:membrane associated rhomboid family serine protease